MVNRISTLRHSLWVTVLLALSTAANGQVETLFQPVGMNTQRVFAHPGLADATGIDFSFSAAISPTFPEDESHILVTVFEWGPTAIGPWAASPDNVNSVRGGTTRFMSTGVFHGPDDAAFVAIHFYAGALMTVSGDFVHASVVPEPSLVVMLATGGALITWVARRRKRSAGWGVTPT